MGESDASSSGRGLVLVAIPANDDPVWKVSSEKVPHLTLLYLDEQVIKSNLNRILRFIEHVANTELCRFTLGVDRRGELGDDKADVLFFDDYFIETLKFVRTHLLQDRHISEAYNSVFQYPSWTPHLTLGYPETPAKSLKEGHDGIHWVRFDRIALWTGDYEGPEILLKSDKYGEVSMSDSNIPKEFMHYGVKGMRWGVIRNHTPLIVETRRRTRDALKIGGEDSADASSVRDIRKKAVKGGTRVLNDDELRKLVKRSELESKFRKIQEEEREASKKFIKGLWDAVGKELVSTLIREGVKYNFNRRRDKKNSSSRATVIDSRILEGATRSLGRFPERS